MDLVPIHREVTSRLLRDAASEALTVTEARPLIAAARHAAVCGDWTLFDDIFRRRLMREPLGYLCDYLGAWDEALSLARLACDSSYPAAATADPAYYPLTAARCLKHLGRSSESRSMSVQGLRMAAASRDPETAMYVNSFLTLLIWRGELRAADRLAELNVRALSWIEEEWRHRWQVEHGFSSIAYLRLLQGHPDTAAVMFDHSEHAWEGYSQDRHWVWDYYPFQQSEVILLGDPSGHDRALASIAPLLSVAKTQDWPEPICRGHLQAAAVHLDRASREGDASSLVRARQRLAEASGIAVGMRVPNVSIAHRLLSFRADLVGSEIGLSVTLDAVAVDEMLDGVERTMAGSGLELARPDLLAARGAAALLAGDRDLATQALSKALERCRTQGNAWASRSPRSFVRWLSDRLDHSAAIDSAGSASDLVDVVGVKLSSTWMNETLDIVVSDNDGAASAT